MKHCYISLTKINDPPPLNKVLRFKQSDGILCICCITFVMVLKNNQDKIKHQHYINITFPARVIVENIIPRNVIINRGAAEVDNHISRDDIFDFHPSRKCNIYFIIPNKTLDPLFSEVELLLLLNRPIMVRGHPKGK